MNDGDPLVCHPLPRNKAGLALLIFERQVIDLPHVSLLDLDADEFRPSHRRLPQMIGTWRHCI